MVRRRLAEVAAFAAIVAGFVFLIVSRAETPTASDLEIGAPDDVPASAPSTSPTTAGASHDESAVASSHTVSGDAEPSVTAPTTTEEPLRSATISFSGDLLLHSRVWRIAADLAGVDDSDGFDFRPMLDPIRELIGGADWSVCHLEVNLDAENRSLSSYPVFRGPGAIARDLREVGFDACSTASNHSLDWGTEATFETIEVLEAAGLRAVGTARSPAEAASSIWFDIEGIRVAHLAYAYWFNGFELPEDQPWAANRIDEARILSDAAAARAAGAEVVILSLHWGDQYQHQPNRQQSELGPRLLGSEDIDLIIGHHAHVVQPVDRIDGEWLVYGMGNLLSNQPQLARRDELIVVAHIEEHHDGGFGVGRLDVIPVFLDLDNLTIWPSGPTLRHDAALELHPALDASWERVTSVLSTGSGWEWMELVGSQSTLNDRRGPWR